MGINIGSRNSVVYGAHFMESNLIDYQNLKTIKQLAEEASFVTESKLRWWIFHSTANGMASAIIKIGGRVYIDRLAFNRWLEGQRLSPLNDNSTGALS